MKFSELTFKEDFIVHKIGDFEFKEKSTLKFDEEMEIVASVINAVTAKTIIKNVIKDKKIANKYLLLFYTLIATDIELTSEEIEDPKSIVEILISNGIDKELYKSPNYINLYDWILSLLKEEQKRKNSFSGLVSELIDGLPEALEILESKLQELDNNEEIKNLLNLAA